ncbi:MAG TPA: PilZ domain-containing protein [Sphingobium sp.]
MQVERQHKRIEVEIPVTVITVLESSEAFIVDLTENGAQITGHSVPEGTRFQVEYMGQTLFAQCRWAEIDRMGIKFLFPLTDGPLYERLLIARASSFESEGISGVSVAMAPIHNGRVTLGARTFSRVATGGFGRRS